MSVADVISPVAGRAFMLCNEAIVRGALEADVKVYSGYPGSPTAEILDIFHQIGEEMGVRATIASNEKVALETVAGAAMAGLRGITSMKSVGLNVASDTLFSLAYVGVRGGLVMVVADDPHAHSSQSEQDGRFFAPAAYVPMLEPSDPSDAKEMVRHAFEISEKFEVPVLIRTVTRVNHQSGVVQLDALERTPYKKIDWPHEPTRFVTVAESARRFKLNMMRRTREIAEEFEESRFNRIENLGSKTGLITSSAGYNYSMEACRILNVRPSILKLGTTFPLPERLLSEFIRPLKQVLVVEELAPYLERTIRELAKDINPGLKILGKRSGHLSEAFEYNPNLVVDALAAVLEIDPPVDYSALLKRAEELRQDIPVRPPTFCPGCPHRATFIALRRALKNVKHVLSDDIGCYSMTALTPMLYGDSILSMGASLGVAMGMQLAIEQPVIAIIGDSTFFHAGLPGLINAVHNRGNFKLIILDNDVTAMTGQQPHPGTPTEPGEASVRRVILDDVVRGMGVEDITIVDPYDVKETTEKMKEALDRPGLGVIISRRVCALHGDRVKRRRGEKIVPNYVEEDACRRIYACVRDFHCPAISLDDNLKAVISRELCDGCMVCSKLCPVTAIKSTGGANQ